MRYVLIGAGAVGSALGGLLAHDGHADVLLVGRGDHARSMLDHGLTVRCPDTTFTVSVPVTTSSDHVELSVDDVLVLTTKTHQAEAALTEWADVPVRDIAGEVVGIAADVLPVLVATNGVASEQIALRYFARVFAVCVWFPVVMIEPGEVIVRGAPLRGVFHVGRYPGVDVASAADTELLDRLASGWRAAGCLVELPTAVTPWKYRKLLSNLSNIVQALLGDASDAADIEKAAEDEAHDVLRHAHIPVVAEQEARSGWHPPGLSFSPVPGEPEQLGGSTWQSLVRGTGTIETDFLNGEIVLIARQHGRAAPVNARLTVLARRAARQRMRPGAITADELRGLVRPRRRTQYWGRPVTGSTQAEDGPAVLIVGAGPTGLTLGVELARRGVSFRLIDAAGGPQTGSRGKGVQPRTLEVFEDLGIAARVLANGRLAMPIRVNVSGGQVILGGAEPEALKNRPDIPYTTSLITPEWRVEEALRLRLAELGGHVEFGTALTGFEQTEDGVFATVVNGGKAETVRAGWLIGCDGGHSTVRKQAGIAFVGRPASRCA
ncbi:FAD-dependent monooxygenase [uncultured Jatrophihabitans sp.]|uniref:FAD-dependent monooxygenase n=1 Tax=uncultured Jatrophihabitans sp. TaxID=1610747 RepID=UPI0035CAD17B